MKELFSARIRGIVFASDKSKMNPVRIFLEELWRTLRLTKTRVGRALAACAAVLASMWIGYRYANEPFIRISPILLSVDHESAKGA